MASKERIADNLKRGEANLKLLEAEKSKKDVKVEKEVKVAKRVTENLVVPTKKK